MGTVYYKFLPVKEEKEEENPSMVRRYRFLPEEKAIYEISDSQLKSISDILKGVDGKELSFGNIFGPDEKRKMIPFKTKAKQDKDLQGLIDLFEKNGYRLDFKTGLATREIEIPKGPQKGKKQKKSIKIGKALQKLVDLERMRDEEFSKTMKNAEKLSADPINDPRPEVKGPRDKARNAEQNIDKLFSIVGNNSKELLKFWNSKSEYYLANPEDIGKEESKYSIIISRHPIDVLRMSDHEDIHSCHSPGSDYYQCAVAEAQGHGLVSYVVRNKDIPKDFNLKDEEIFADSQRGVEGVTPISRLRLRKYVVKDGEYEIAGPEDRAYGKKIPGFKETVLKWAQESQGEIKKVLSKDGEVPEFADFERQGGSYGDTRDGQILNALFGTEKYSTHDDVSHEIDPAEDEDGELAAEQLMDEYEREAQEIQETADRKLKYSSVYYEVEMGEGHPYVMFGGGTNVEFKSDDFIKEFPSGWRETSKIARELSDTLNNEGFYSIEEIEIDDGATETRIMLRLSIGDYEPNPNGFESFYNDVVLDEFDDEYDKLHQLIRAFFAKEGYMNPSEYGKTTSKLQDLEDADEQMFENFDVDVDDDGMDVTNKTPIYVDLKGYDKTYPNKIDGILYQAIMSFSDSLEEAEKKSPLPPKQLQIPGTEIKAEKGFSPDMSDVDLYLKFETDKSESTPDPFSQQSRPFKGFAKILVEMNSSSRDSDDVVLSTFAYAKFMDENFQFVQKTIQESYSETVARMGLKPDRKLDKIDISSEYERQKAKNTRDVEDFTELEYLPEFEVYLKDTGYAYFDFGRVLFLDEITGNSMEIFNKGDQWEYQDHVTQYYLELFLLSFFVGLQQKLKSENPNVQYIIFDLDNIAKHAAPSNATDVRSYIDGVLFDDNILDNSMKVKSEVFYNQYPELKGYAKSLKDTYIIPLEAVKENKKMKQKRLRESDRDISSVVDKLIMNKKILDIVKLMAPLDIAKVIAIELDLHPVDSAKAALGLIKHNHDVHYEGLAGGSIETNKQYPIPPAKRRKNHVNPEIGIEAGYKKDEGMMAKPQGKTDATPHHDIPRHHFPPDPRDRPEGWPYDAATKAGMDPAKRGHRRGLTSGKDVRYVFKKGNPFNTDLRLGQDGMDGGGGIYQKSRHSRDNSTPSGPTWSKQGSPGWSSSPPGKEYDMPDDLRVDELDEEEEELNIEKNPPVGSPLPMLGYGGRDDGSHQVGPRKGFRKK